MSYSSHYWSASFLPVLPLAVSYADKRSWKKDAQRNAKTQIKQEGHSQRRSGSSFTFKWASSWSPTTRCSGRWRVLGCRFSDTLQLSKVPQATGSSLNYMHVFTGMISRVIMKECSANQIQIECASPKINLISLICSLQKYYMYALMLLLCKTKICFCIYSLPYTRHTVYIFYICMSNAVAMKAMS